MPPAYTVKRAQRCRRCSSGAVPGAVLGGRPAARSAPRPTCRCGSSSPGLGCARTRAAGSPGPRAPRPQIQANVGTRNFARSRPHGPEREGLPGSRLRPQLVTPRAVAMGLPARDIPPAPGCRFLTGPEQLDSAGITPARPRPRGRRGRGEWERSSYDAPWSSERVLADGGGRQARPRASRGDPGASRAPRR